MKQVERFYDGHARGYEAKFALPLARRVKRMEEEGVLAFLAERLPPPGEETRLLELGCGTGLFTLPMAARGYRITAVDISRGMLDELEAKLGSEGLSSSVELRKADVEEMAASGEAFDAIYGIGLLEYLSSPARALELAAGMLKPGGVAAFTAPTVSLNGLCYVLTSLVRKRMRMRLQTRGSLARLFTGAGLELIEVRPVGFHLPLMMPLTRIAAGRRPGNAQGPSKPSG